MKCFVLFASLLVQLGERPEVSVHSNAQSSLIKIALLSKKFEAVLSQNTNHSSNFV